MGQGCGEARTVSRTYQTPVMYVPDGCVKRLIVGTIFPNRRMKTPKSRLERINEDKRALNERKTGSAARPDVTISSGERQRRAGPEPPLPGQAGLLNESGLGAVTILITDFTAKERHIYLGAFVDKPPELDLA